MSDVARRRGRGAARSGWKLLRLLAAAGTVAVPAILLACTPLAPGIAYVFAGVIPAVVASLTGRRLAIGAVAGTALLVALVELARPAPWAATALAMLLGLAVGASALRGWHLIALNASGLPLTLLIGPALQTPAVPAWSDGAAQVLTPAALTLLGGAWAILAAAVLLRGAPSRALVPQSRHDVIRFGLVLAVLLGVATLITTIWFRGTFAGWILLTIVVIVRPEVADTKRRIIDRTAGTILGGAAAALLALLVPVHAVLVAVGLVAMVAVLVFQVTRVHYALYAAALTAAIVLLNTPDADVLAVDVERVAFTVAGALATALVVFAVQGPVRIRRRASVRPAGED